MSHVTPLNAACHTYERVKSHIWIRHVSHMNESCHTYEWVMSHIWISRITGCAFWAVPCRILSFWWGMSHSCMNKVWVWHIIHECDIPTHSCMNKVWVWHTVHECDIPSHSCMNNVHEVCHTHVWIRIWRWHNQIAKTCSCVWYEPFIYSCMWHDSFATWDLYVCHDWFLLGCAIPNCIFTYFWM